MAIFYLLLIVSTITSLENAKVYSQDLPSCDSKIYCTGNLIDVVQRAKLFDDSKSFVDQKMLHDEQTILNAFNNMMNKTENNPTREEIGDFVRNNFADGNELRNWTLPDFNANPEFFGRIKNKTLKNFASDLVNIWPTLAREIKPEVLQNIDRYSLIPVPNGFVVPGGRFKETYYWDSYWIIEGLLISEMPKTAQAMIENFLHLVDKFGFIPNGSRVYYLNRSQPPFLTSMARLLFDYTEDTEWLQKNLPLLEKELQFFLDQRTITFNVSNKQYTLAHYDSESGFPRPESYSQDVETCAPLLDVQKIRDCYADLKSGAETGWDFSFRWVFDEYGGNNANRTNLQTRRVIPVELNTLLAKSFRDIAYFYKNLNDVANYTRWNTKFIEWKSSIHEVLFNEDRGVWFDFDVVLGKHREIFYPTNIAPLWGELYGPKNAEMLGRSAYHYLMDQEILMYPGGTPTSLNNTGEQWDFPNAWAPLQYILNLGLHRSGDEKAQDLARILIDRWVQANLLGFLENHKMYEKYDALHPGETGGGGEYAAQDGFGWSNGVILKFIHDFYTKPV